MAFNRNFATLSIRQVHFGSPKSRFLTDASPICLTISGYLWNANRYFELSNSSRAEPELLSQDIAYKPLALFVRAADRLRTTTLAALRDAPLKIQNGATWWSAVCHGTDGLESRKLVTRTALSTIDTCTAPTSAVCKTAAPCRRYASKTGVMPCSCPPLITTHSGVLQAAKPGGLLCALP